MSAISIVPERCTGCQSCEMFCSLFHEGSCSSSLSRIRIKKWEEISVFMPVVCQHCEKPPCITICPTQARKRVPGTDAVVTDGKRCVGCKSCLYACPYNAPVLHPVTQRTMTCDLCDGKPLCAEVCAAGALFYIPEGDPSMERKRTFGQIFLQSARATLRRSDKKPGDSPSSRSQVERSGLALGNVSSPRHQRSGGQTDLAEVLEPSNGSR